MRPRRMRRTVGAERRPEKSIGVLRLRGSGRDATRNAGTRYPLLDCLLCLFLRDQVDEEGEADRPAGRVSPAIQVV